MIDLSGELSLGSLVLTKDGTLKYSYILPRGMEFPSGAEGYIRLTDRAGGEYQFSPHYGEPSEDMTKMLWQVESNAINHVPAGANFEVFISYEGSTYKVRYGRVVRKEATYPLNPLSVEEPPMMYEDDLQRNAPGTRWIAKAGQVSMHGISGITDLIYGNPSGTGYGMASRNVVDVFGAGLNLFQNASAMWYAPVRSDSIEIAVGLTGGNMDGSCTVVFSSDYSMKNFLGVSFSDPGGTPIFNPDPSDTIQAVAATNWTPWNFDTMTRLGTGINYSMPSQGGKYKITYSPSAGINVFTPSSSTTPALHVAASATANTGAVSGAGYRYAGVIFTGSFVTTGPMLYYWKIKDAV